MRTEEERLRSLKEYRRKTYLRYAKLGSSVGCSFFIDVSKIEVDTRDENGNTALMIAAQNGHLHTVRFLESKGAQIGAKNKFGETALDLAKSKGESRIVKYLEVPSSQHRGT